MLTNLLKSGGSSDLVGGKPEVQQIAMTVSAGGNHTVAHKSDGTAVADGLDKLGSCEVGDWTDIVAVSAGEYHTVGLKSDGTLVAKGNNKYGECDVGDWSNIKIPE